MPRASESAVATRRRGSAKDLEARAYRFFCGKGGVGKTTCAAAAAVAAAESGARVLVLSTDPAHSLADALQARLGAAPRRVPTRRGWLDAAHLDARLALDRWLDDPRADGSARRELLATIAERGTYLDAADVRSFLGLSLPGVDELVGLVEMRRLGHGYDEVVVDTAPTGHTLRLLAMPETLQRLALVFDDMQEKHRVIADGLRGGHRPDAADALVEELAGEAATLTALLRDPERAQFVLVLLAEKLAVAETLDAARALGEDGIAPARLVVNRTTLAPGEPCGLCAGRRSAETLAIAELRRALPAVPLGEVPALAAEPRGAESLRRVARALATPPPVRARETAKARAPARAARASGEAGVLATLAGAPGLRLLMFAGKGGVGKSSCAAATALALAARDPSRRTLLLSTDPAHSLGDVLALEAGDEERAVPGAPGLRVRELDARRAFDAQRERYKQAVDALFDGLRGGSRFDAAYDRAVVQDLIELAPPGLDEIVAVLTVSEALFPESARAAGGEARADRRARQPGAGDAARRSPPAARAEYGRRGSSSRLARVDPGAGYDREGSPGARADSGAGYDLVVVDSAPTGHALRLLELPGQALAWVHALLRLLLKYREVVGLGALAADLTALARGLRVLEQALRDPERTRVVAVTRAAELPRLETERLLAALGELHIAAGAVIVNALTPPGCARCRAQAVAEEEQTVRLERVLGSRTREGPAPRRSPPPMGDGREGGAPGVREHRAPCVMVEAPALAPPPRGVQALRRWIRRWEVR